MYILLLPTTGEKVHRRNLTHDETKDQILGSLQIIQLPLGHLCFNNNSVFEVPFQPSFQMCYET